MKNIWIVILTVIFGGVAFAGSINLEINANYFSYKMKPAGSFASTNLSVNFPYIQKNLEVQITPFQTPQATISSISLISSEISGVLLNSTAGSTAGQKVLGLRDFEMWWNGNDWIGSNLDMPFLHGWAVYNYKQTKLEDLSMGFNAGPFSVLGYINSNISTAYITTTNGVSLGADLTNQSTVSLNANLPVSFGNILIDAGLEYVASPTQFKPNLRVFYMGNGFMPYLAYDTQSTPVINAGLFTMNFSFYGGITVTGTPTYTVGGQYRSPFGNLGAGFTYYVGASCISANFNSVPFGFNFLQFTFNGQGQFRSNGNYSAVTSLEANFNLFLATIQGWWGLNMSNGGFSNFYGLDVNF